MGETRPSRTDERERAEKSPARKGEPPAERSSQDRTLSELGDRLGIDALTHVSWRRKWVGRERTWQVSEAAFPREGTLAEKARFLLRYAVLAPSSHNTQPWLFTVGDEAVRLFADLDRWLTVADPDKRELYVSLGAALENLLVAAEHFGMGYDVRYLPGSDTAHAATVRLSAEGEDGEAKEGEKTKEDEKIKEDEEDEFESSESRPEATARRDPRLFEAIPRRRTNRRRYQERTVPTEDLRALQEACVEEDVTLQFVADPRKTTAIADLTARAERRQFADPAYRRELGRWIGRGAFGDSWLAAKLGKLLVTYLNVGPRQARKDAGLARSAPLLAVVRTETDGRRAQIRAGQVFERVSLAATALDLQTHPMSALLEVPSLRRELTDLLGRPDRPPQHLFRLGFAATVAEPSPRRPPEAVLVE